ncbi:hypothetical protein ILUMI_00694 [Ignelater luminosus]|uniref:Uncharacterized protein n=1 Tax=Ignelater luminosus TaxID=2038154 RepID=A0A8K0DLE6_IGNLU|nr:hypothetical protein ILUMI_00694 [Ignelater luminosus]
MPDVTRSDSQRSDASLRPRVSFNRDVHVKRIVPNEASRVTGALSGDGAGHLLPSPVRKERLPKSKQQLAEEAARVLQEVDKIDCVSKDHGVHPEKFYTLPARRKHKINVDSPQSSIDRKTRRRKSEELGVTTESPPKKPPRTFAHYPKSEKSQRNSIFNIFKRSDKELPESPKKSNLRRSISDATNLKSKAFGPVDDVKPVRKRAGSDSEDNPSNLKSNKKQLSPIIEVTQREDYFSHNDKENIHSVKEKENVEQVGGSIKRKKEKKGESKPEKQESVTEKLKEYIDEVDTALFNETGIRVDHSKSEKKAPEIVIIDVDKAEKISNKKDKSKLNTGAIGKKIKSLTNKKEKIKKTKSSAKTKEKPPANAKQKGVLKADNTSEKRRSVSPKDQVKVEIIKIPDTQSPSPKVKKVIDNLQSQGNRSPKMIHSSQQPPEKLPLTRGLTVDTMVKRLNSDKSSPPPPKTSILVTPNVTVQHNNNQPFSYTRGHSPERNHRSPDGSRSPVNPGSPIIYAHVVCDKGGINSSGPTKQTVHAAYTNGKKHLPHSDSDEGLGNEENSGFSRTKYAAEKSVTHFGDERYMNEQNGFNGNRHGDDFYKDPDHFEEEYPITPKFKNVGYNGFKNYNEYTKTEHSIFIDSSSRGRGDGMDAKRRESLTEPHENGFATQKYNINSSRTDLSARRDLLESRINRRLGEKGFRQSPPSNSTPYNSKYTSEITSKYYRHGSASPVGFTEAYTSEIKADRNGERYKTESRTRKVIGENENISHNNRYKQNEYRYNSYDNEPKSFDSQISDYRSSPENIARRIDASHEYKYSHSNKYMSREDKQKLSKDREHYKSNPEIIQRNYDNTYKYDDHDKYQETYHDSLKREKHEARVNSTTKYRPERYFDQNDCERKDKLGDSGIENDFKRDSGDNFRTPRSSTQRREYFNESEDEGFASSLLIASERQHTEDNINSRKMKRDYDSDRGYREDRDRERDESYRNVENMDYKMAREYKIKETRHEYAPRERSIDDGSHYDPRIDKDLDVDRSTLKKKLDKKPPKPEKKSSLEKVKQLFSRDSSKKNKKEKEKGMVPEENLRARYTEYKGSRENLEAKAVRKNVNEVKTVSY